MGAARDRGHARPPRREGRGVTVIDDVTTRPYSGAAGITIRLYSQDAQAVTFHYDNVLIDSVF